MPAMDTLQMVASAKMLIVLIIMAGASIMDVRYRRIPDRFWMLAIAGAGPLTFWEMYLRGGGESPITFLSLLLPVSGMLFILYGYPEPREMLKGKPADVFFFLFYTAAVIGTIAAFLLGDRGLFVDVGLSFIFMLMYFVLYSVPIGGTRIIHGGADAKCLMVLAALFPWYVLGTPLQTGPFFNVLPDIPAIGRIFPISLSVLFNAAVLTALVLFLYLPVRNLVGGAFSLHSFTSYRARVKDLEGKHVWVMVDGEGGVEKKDPTAELINDLVERDVEYIKVTPKIPFILSLTVGFLVQMILGNLVAVLFFTLA